MSHRRSHKRPQSAETTGGVDIEIETVRHSCQRSSPCDFVQQSFGQCGGVRNYACNYAGSGALPAGSRGGIITVSCQHYQPSRIKLMTQFLQRALLSIAETGIADPPACPSPAAESAVEIPLDFLRALLTSCAATSFQSPSRLECAAGSQSLTMDLSRLTRPAILCQCSRCSSSLAALENEWAKLSNSYSLVAGWLSVDLHRISISSEKKQIPQSSDMAILRGRVLQEISCKLCQQKLGVLCPLENG